MDAKDLRIDAVSSGLNNDGTKYTQTSTVLQGNRNKSYHDIGSNSLAKVDVQTARPCAVIGPDRVVPPPATPDAYLKKSAVDPWLYPENSYRRPPDYPHRLASYQNPTRNISPRQTFQENMQRIMVPPTYSSVKLNDDSSFAHIADRSSVLTKNTKLPLDGKYCDVPYNVNPVNEPKIVRNPEVCVSSANPTIVRTAPPGWPPGSVNLPSPRAYGTPDLYQYPEYPSCAGPRPMTLPRPHRTIQEEPSHVYPDAYYQDGNIRYKPYPPPKERYPQARYEYIGNYSNPFHPSSPFPPHKYELQKQIHPHPYSGYSPLKFLENRITDPHMDGYQRSNQANFNIAYRNQIIHPTYGPMLGNQNKMHVYPPDSKMKSIHPNNNKMYLDYDNARNKPYPVSDNFFVNEMNRIHPMKSQVVMAGHPAANMYPMPPHPYFKKDNPGMKTYDYMTHLKNMDPSINNPLLRHPSRFSPSSVAISPTDSNASNDTAQTHGTLQEDCGYVSQSSTASGRSMDTGMSRHPHDFYRRYDYRYTPVIRTSPLSNSEHNNAGSAKKNLDVRQFLQMWNEGDEETDNNSAKELNVPTPARDSLPKQHEVPNNNTQEQLYVLGLVNVPSEELSKYEHIQKVSKLPENIKGYNSLELLNQFEEVIQSSKINCPNPPQPRSFSSGPVVKPQSGHMQRPLSPLDVEAKISQSVIHKDVGCNFEIKPCSPKMLNVEIAAPIQNILDERLIEKVANPHMIRTQLLSGIDENIDSYNVVKRQDHLLTISDNENSSCKMVKTQFSSDHPIDSIKTNYSLQDLESNSGVCLASLPRLDNDIELHFPEVNQQFINANKSPVTQTSCNDLPAIEVNETPDKLKLTKENEFLFAESECNSQRSTPNDTEREFVKLSKYRKLKPTEKKEDRVWQNNTSIRTDSVIIKNPENLKILEDFSEKIDNTGLNNPIQHTPINLTAYCNDIDDVQSSLKSDLSKAENVNISSTSFDNAIDFSLNKQHSTTFECKINLKDDSIETNNECKIFNHQYSDERPPVCSDVEDKFEKMMNSVASENDIKLKTDIPIIETKDEDVLSHEKSHLASLPLISPIYDDTNNIDKNNIIYVNSVKEELSEEPKKPTEEDEIDKHSRDPNDQLTVSDEISSEIENKLFNDSVKINPDIQLDDIINEDVKESSIDISDNTSCTSSENDMPKLFATENSIFPGNNRHTLYTDSESAITNGDIESNDQKSSPEYSISNSLLQVKNKMPVLENQNYMNINKSTDSSSDRFEPVMDTETKPANETTECMMNQTEHLESGYFDEFRPQLHKKEIKTFLDKSVNVHLRQNSISYKALYSPWIQKLIMHTEGLCTNILNNVSIQETHENNALEKSTLYTDIDELKTELNSTDNEKDENLICSSEGSNNNGDSSQCENSEEYTSIDKIFGTNQSINLTDVTASIVLSEKTYTPVGDSIVPETTEITEKNKLSKINGNDKIDAHSDQCIEIPARHEDTKLENAYTAENNTDTCKPQSDNSLNKITITDNYSNLLPDVESKEIENMLEANISNNSNNNESLEDIAKLNIESHCEMKSNVDDIELTTQNIFTAKRISLKRSLSESALSSYYDDITENLGSRSLHKRRKNRKSSNSGLITEDVCPEIVHHNRRNSVSTYNEENVSICIFIDNNCIITEDNSEEQKFCYADLADNCYTEVEEAETEFEVENADMLAFDNPQEDVSDIVSVSEVSALECDGDKEIHESWVDDVACVETVVSDEIAEDITIGSSPSSPKYTDYSDNDESGVFSSTATNYTNTIIYHDKMFADNSQLYDSLYLPSHFSKSCQSNKDSYKYYDKESLERILSESNSQQGSPCSLDRSNSLLILSETLNSFKTPDDKENVDLRSLSPAHNTRNFLENIPSDVEIEEPNVNNFEFEKTQDDTVHSCESSIDNVFSYKETDGPSNCIASRSPEVSSTTSEERNTSILLKITNYKGSRISQINDVIDKNQIKCKFTNEEAFVNTIPSLPLNRPLITKAAQKYIPPLKESTRDLKVKLPLPKQSLLKLKQMKNSKDEPKLNKLSLTIPKTLKKPKPKFEDVLKSIDEIQFKMHKEKNKKSKKVVPKVVIKKTQNGSHYTSTSNKDVYNPDLTGRKWQPWVFLEKNNFIDKMAIRRKTKAVFNHRKNTYVLAEKFRKYKSVNSAKFVISQPKTDESSSGHLKYTIRLKHTY